jgi:hypothetical protein
MSAKNIKELIREANQRALDRLLSADAIWTGISPAIEVLPGVGRDTVLHSGPPIEWERMSILQKKGIIGGILFEKLADSEKEAQKIIEKGNIKVGAANDFGVVGAGVGIVTPSMMLNVCEDKNSGARGYCAIWEGRAGLGTWGLFTDETRENLQMIQSTMGPALNKILQDCGGIPLKSIIARGLQMGDEGHTRQVAQGLILASEIVPHFLRSDLPKEIQIQCSETIIKTDRWFHPLGMASSMAILNGIKNIEYCTLITGMAGNGVDFGIKVSALGEKWFRAPAPAIQGKYLSTRWGPEDAIPWLGESCVTENVGLGGISAAAAPLVLRLRGGTLQDAIKQTEEMRAVCIGTNHNYPIPTLDFAGPPIGIDIRKILDTGISPALHGGIISKEGGQIGAGSARLPIECVQSAFYAFAEKYDLI